MDTTADSIARSRPAAFGGGALIGALGGLIGLAGLSSAPAAHRPVRFAALEA